MSYHRNVERNKDVKEEIAMPPLPPESTETPEVEHSSEQSEVTIEAAVKQQDSSDIAALAATVEKQSEDAVKIEQQLEQRESAQAKNFRELREQKERAVKERDDLARRIKELEHKDPYSLAPDDLVEGKHLSHHANELKQLKEELSQYKQQWHQNSVESKLRSRYSDFDSVVNATSLSELNPAVAQSLKILAQTDLEAAGEAAYDILRSRVSQKPAYTQDVKTAQANSAKPRPVSSISPQHGETPLSQANAFANGLTPELQKKLLEEMNSARRSY